MIPKGIQAIETKYKGYRFRSRLEARWAVFFDALGLEWEYEKEGFVYGNGTQKVFYLPDFWLPQVKMWAEVKPGIPSDQEILKAALLAKSSGCPVLILDGVPENRPYASVEYLDGRLASIEYCLTMYHDYPIEEGRFYSMPGDYSNGGDAYWDDTEEAANAARSARFEFGESGGANHNGKIPSG